ncbi:MAG: S8 family serine peptidase [Candidatus Delongbacteria bacterium]|nr:S8 family serine peptidase [Candidatus Delongbacteria bacterium]
MSSIFDAGIHTSSGTSFSAPHVTGVVAQLIEKYGSSVNINNYVTYFKGRLMLGAQASLVDDTSHRTGDSAIFYNHQGAGFLDATNSAKSIAGWNKYVRLSTLSSNYYVYIFTPPMDFSIRAVLIFEKPENSQVTSNYGNSLNLYLQSPGGTVFSSSTSSTNIFEMLEYTIPANQDILLRVNRAAYISSSLYISISCFWMGV